MLELSLNAMKDLYTIRRASLQKTLSLRPHGAEVNWFYSELDWFDDRHSGRFCRALETHPTSQKCPANPGWMVCGRPSLDYLR